MSGAIDIVINLYTPEALSIQTRLVQRFPRRQNRRRRARLFDGLPIEEHIARMDRAGIQMVFIAAAKAGPLGHPASWHLPYEMVAEIVRKYPNRFRGTGGY